MEEGKENNPKFTKHPSTLRLSVGRNISRTLGPMAEARDARDYQRTPIAIYESSPQTFGTEIFGH